MGVCSSTRVVAEARQLARMELEPTPFGSSGRASLGRGSPGRVMRGQKVSAIKRHPPARRRVLIIFCTSAPSAFSIYELPATPAFQHSMTAWLQERMLANAHSMQCWVVEDTCSCSQCPMCFLKL